MRNNYVIKQVQRINIPEFAESPTRRYRMIFSGRVQHVGFRFETRELAKRLKLTGFCGNREDGNVLAEIQGPENKINFLVDFMKSLVRIKIKNIVVDELKPIENENDFKKI